MILSCVLMIDALIPGDAVGIGWWIWCGQSVGNDEGCGDSGAWSACLGRGVGGVLRGSLTVSAVVAPPLPSLLPLISLWSAEGKCPVKNEDRVEFGRRRVAGSKRVCPHCVWCPTCCPGRFYARWRRRRSTDGRARVCCLLVLDSVTSTPQWIRLIAPVVAREVSQGVDMEPSKGVELFCTRPHVYCLSSLGAVGWMEGVCQKVFVGLYSGSQLCVSGQACLYVW